MAMGGLATRLSNLPTWAVYTITEDSLDLAPGGVPLPPMEPAKSRSELLGLFDSNVAKARDAIAAASDEELFKGWTLLHGGKQILTLPKVAVLRSFVMNHNIHHRAQLGVFCGSTTYQCHQSMARRQMRPRFEAFSVRSLLLARTART